MKNTDKITLTVGQLKKLMKESKQIYEASPKKSFTRPYGKRYLEPETEMEIAVSTVVRDLIYKSFEKLFNGKPYDELDREDEKKVFDYVQKEFNSGLARYTDKTGKNWKRLASSIGTFDIEEATKTILRDMYQEI